MKYINYKKNEGVVLIELNRPERLNALGAELCDDLTEALNEFEIDDEARVAILTGKGKAFSAGADIKEMAEVGKPGLGARKRGPESEGDPYGFRKVTKPTISAVNGFAYGGGCHVVLGTDIRIAAESATFSLAEINLGLFGNANLLYLQGVPLCVVMELALIGKPISAQRACQVGLVNFVVPDNELMTAVRRMADGLAQLSPLALRLNKRIVRDMAASSEQVSSYMWMVAQELRGSKDAAEATKAFAEKRKPVFRGE